MRSSSIYSETGVTSDEWIDLEETDTETYYDAQDKNPFIRASNVRQGKILSQLVDRCRTSQNFFGIGLENSWDNMYKEF